MIVLVKQRIFPAAQAPATIVHRIDVSASTLDGYVGYYQWDDDDLITIVTRQGSKLFVQYPGADATEIIPESQTQFVTPNGDTRFYFTPGDNGHASRLNMPVHGINFFAPRIAPAVGQQIFAAQVAKIRNHTVTPGSDVALRRVIDEMQSGRPNYGAMNVAFAQAVRQNLPSIQKQLASFGSIRSIEFIGVDKEDADIYEVALERAYTEWHINMGQNGVVKSWSYDVEKSTRMPM